MWLLHQPKPNDANDVRQTIVDGKPLCIFHCTHTHTQPGHGVAEYICISPQKRYLGNFTHSRNPISHDKLQRKRKRTKMYLTGTNQAVQSRLIFALWLYCSLYRRNTLYQISVNFYIHSYLRAMRSNRVSFIYRYFQQIVKFRLYVTNLCVFPRYTNVYLYSIQYIQLTLANKSDRQKASFCFKSFTYIKNNLFQCFADLNSKALRYVGCIIAVFTCFYFNNQQGALRVCFVNFVFVFVCFAFSTAQCRFCCRRNVG